MSEKFNANGQIVFVEPEWITGKTCLFTVNNMSDYIKGMLGLTKIRRAFIERLVEEGFTITHNKHNQTNDIIHLIMNDEAIMGANGDEALFKKAFDQRIFAAGGEKLNYPLSSSMEDFFNNPFYPAVLKNESTNGGKDKFLIETPEQLEVIKKFYKKFKKIEPYNFAFNSSIFQQLIETPTEHKTYLRVLMSASGDVLGASIKYSRVTDKKREARSIFEKHFWDKESEFFVDLKGMFNYYSGGGDINLAKTRFSYEEREILKAHGISPENPCVPTDVLEVASNIAINCNPELGIICGIDFILDKNTNKWYYLEVQAFPAIDEWANARRKRIVEVRNINDYIKYNALDLEARYEALMMVMAKKQEKSDSLKLRREFK